MTSRFPKTIYRGWWIVLVAWLALLISNGTTSYLINLLSGPMERDLGWDRSTVYGALSMAGVVSGLLSAPIGPLLDRYGGRVLMTISAALSGVALALTGAVHEPWQCFLVLGVGVAITRPALNVGPRMAIANWFIQKRPLAFGLYSTGNPAAAGAWSRRSHGLSRARAGAGYGSAWG